MRPRIFVTRQLPGDPLAQVRDRYEIDVWPEEGAPPYEMLLRKAAESDGLLVMLTDRIDAPLLGAAPRLRAVSTMAVGYDNIDVEAATTQGVAVCHTPGILTETTADLAFALLLAAARRVGEGERMLRAGRWRGWAPTQLLGRDVHGATLGIVGMGAIGQAVARRALGFGMSILYTSRSEHPRVERELGARRLPLDAVLAASDFVSLHVALTPETRGLIGERELARMQRHAVLINTARGPVVDQRALYAALREGRIAAAGLDVFETEPLPADDPLLALENVVLLPHIGSASVATRTAMARIAVENLIAALEGREPANCLNWQHLVRESR
ncbi:MAG TPA: D-glycerate dehydrogenase [Dehalococcoidia bacterium]|nr:D-glycerate dehydrogenase [Dehalococcoidia bacterium]